MGRIWEWLRKFLFPAESDRWLSLLRIGLGAQVTIFALSSRGDWIELLANSGRSFVNREVTEAVLNVESLYTPRLGWLIWIGSHLGISDTTVLWAVWGCLFGSGCLLVLGLFSRPAAITAWLLYLSTIKSEQFLTYGVDNFTTIGLFYLMLSPLPDRYALDHRRLRSMTPNPELNGFLRRVLQIHVCIIYLFGGLTKCIGPGWWNGDSIWRALTSPPYNLVSPQLLLTWKFLLPSLGIMVCVIETAFPIFIWFKPTRLLWLGLVCGMHLAIGLTMGLHLFSLIMIILNLAAFGPDFSFKPERVAALYSRLVQNKKPLTSPPTVRPD